ncbi:MAG: CocE/NonD family hydrolase [Bacteroidetes bacterium]|nr:CocE/NonD family hydrolase [Bacteroidota bacterium]
MNRIVAFLILSVIATPAFSQLLSPQIDSIPLRDGKKLSADVYIPDGGAGQQYPVILIQTPYNRIFYRWSLPLGTGQNLAASPYAFVTVDWRGFYGSYQAATALPDRGEDGYDVVEWIAQQSWSNGKIGTWGPSALGKIQFQTAQNNPPHLTCCVPLVAGPQYEYLEYFPGGVYREEYVNQLDNLGYGMSSTLLANPVRNNLWAYMENQNYYPQDIAVPTLMIGGWYDHNTELMFDFFNGIRQSSPIAVRDKHRFLLGPWAHGGFGATQVGTGQQGELFYPDAAGWSDSIALLHFDYYLRDIQNNWNTSPYIQYFRMGEDFWENTTSWPPSGFTPTNFYLQNDGTLDPTAPSGISDSQTIQYDPRDPSPTVGGSTLTDSLGQGPYDQSPEVESRNDILIFSTPTLISNVVLKGSPVAHLFVSADRLDSDFAIRLTDVYPDGRSMILLDGIRRLRFRNGYNTTDTISAVPGNIYELVIELPPTCISFLAGHKIRLDVTSSDYPRFSRNLNNGGPMYSPGDTLIATNTVYLNTTNASYISLPIDNYSVSIPEPFQHKEVVVLYPNPASDHLNIESTAITNEEFTFDIITVTGAVAFSGKTQWNSGKATISLPKLPDGNYFIQTSDHFIFKSFQIKN